MIVSKIVALEDTASIAGDHHERLDGKGYPRGIGGQNIDLNTRIVTVADIFDALTADRPYRKAMTVPDALKLLRRDLTTGVDAECFAALERGLVGSIRMTA
jgi:HD-GYP domain-containing protein (c-di-GMP phosphodiesterase class II)